jgi:hypothetical protein
MGCSFNCEYYEDESKSDAGPTKSERSVVATAKNASQFVPKVEGQFVQLSDVYAIAQVNPVAALVALRFVPEYYVPIAFYEGQGVFNRVFTATTIHSYIDRDSSQATFEKTTKPAPEGTIVLAEWRVSSKNHRRKPFGGLRPFFQESSTLARLQKVFPTIEVQLTPTEPYRVTGWSIR